VWCEDRQERGRGVKERSPCKDAAPSHHVAKAAGREEEDRGGEEVGGRDPGEDYRIGPEFLADQGEREVDARARERVEEGGDGHHHEDKGSGPGIYPLHVALHGTITGNATD